MSTVFETAPLGPLTLRNRIVKAATFEGRSKGGVVTDELVDFHRRMAAGGVAMTTVAYLAVAPDGRTDDGCVVLGPASVPGLRRLTDAVHEQGALAAAQVGHAGPVANAASNKVPAYSAGQMFNPLGMRRTRAAKASDIARITDDYRRGAQAAVEAGFDSLELHLGHNYLLSAFLSPLLNRRSDDYGGPLEHRARFAREVVTAVREAVGRDVAVTAKLNMADGVRGGLRPEESLQVATWLQDDGALDAIRRRGRDISMDEVASEIGVSKTVLYRYFVDKNDLTTAVMMRFAQTTLIPNLAAALSTDLDGFELTREIIRVYVETVAAEPEPYRFVMANSSASKNKVIADSEQIIARMLALVLRQRMQTVGMDTRGVEPWAFMIVGGVQLATHSWMSHPRMSTEDLIGYLTMMCWSSLCGIVEAGGSLEKFTSDPHP